MNENLCQKLYKVRRFDEGDQGCELRVEGEEVKDGARLPSASVQGHRKVESAPGHHSEGEGQESNDHFHNNS